MALIVLFGTFVLAATGVHAAGQEGIEYRLLTRSAYIQVYNTESLQHMLMFSSRTEIAGF
jgi:hypothetical protein